MRGAFPYAEEMWELFQQNALTPETRLEGRYRPSERRANTEAVLDLIQDANYDERKRREARLRRHEPQRLAALALVVVRVPDPRVGAASGVQLRRPRSLEALSAPVFASLCE